MQTWHRHSHKIDGTSPIGKQYIHTLSSITFHHRYSKLGLLFLTSNQITIFLWSQLHYFTVGISYFIRNINEVDLPKEKLRYLCILEILIYSEQCQSYDT